MLNSVQNFCRLWIPQLESQEPNGANYLLSFFQKSTNTTNSEGYLFLNVLMSRLRLLSDKNYDRTNIIYLKFIHTKFQIFEALSIPINNEYWVYPKQLIWDLVCTFIDMYDLTYFNRIGEIFFSFFKDLENNSLNLFMHNTAKYTV